MAGSLDDFLAEISAIAPKKCEAPKIDVLISKPPETDTSTQPFLQSQPQSQPPPQSTEIVANTSGEPVVPQPPKKYNYIIK